MVEGVEHGGPASFDFGEGAVISGLENGEADVKVFVGFSVFVVELRHG